MSTHSWRCGGQILLATCHSLSLLAAFWPADTAECILQLKPQLQYQLGSKRNGISTASRLVSYRFHLFCLKRAAGYGAEMQGGVAGYSAKQMANGCSYQSLTELQLLLLARPNRCYLILFPILQLKSLQLSARLMLMLCCGLFNSCHSDETHCHCCRHWKKWRAEYKFLFLFTKCVRAVKKNTKIDYT